MRLARIAIADADGAILAHGLRVGTSVFKKGRVLSAMDIAALDGAGIAEVMAGRLGPDDIAEDEAVTTIARAAGGQGTDRSAAFTGRCNLYATHGGLVVIDRARLDRINLLDESLTIATLAPFDRVAVKRMVATVKVIPFAAPAAVIAEARDIAGDGGPLVRIAPFAPMRAGLVLSRVRGTKDSVLDRTVETVSARLDALGGQLVAERRVGHDEIAIAEAIGALRDEGRDLILISGASAIVDRGDVVPLGIEAAGGAVDHFGMPVDPGNLLLLGHIAGAGGDNVPVIGLPGCARSPKLNGFDWVLERLAAGLDVTRRDIMLMGAGGLLKEIASRPQPRHGPVGEVADARVVRAPQIAVVVLAAGQSRRMGALNKLLAEIDGTAMVRGVVETVLASKARPVVVVTGHQAGEVRAALAGLDVRFVHNPDYEQGLSTSLRHGIGALDEALDGAVDGALVCLGDMPQVSAGHLDKVIAAFDPDEGRAICVPTSDGKRGNPVLWGAQFFAEIGAVSGDVGARHLIGEYAEMVCEVELGDGAVLVDIDTPEALGDLRAAGSA